MKSLWESPGYSWPLLSHHLISCFLLPFTDDWIGDEVVATKIDHKISHPSTYPLPPLPCEYCSTCYPMLNWLLFSSSFEFCLWENRKQDLSRDWENACVLESSPIASYWNHYKCYVWRSPASPAGMQEQLEWSWKIPGAFLDQSVHWLLCMWLSPFWTLSPADIPAAWRDSGWSIRDQDGQPDQTRIPWWAKYMVVFLFKPIKFEAICSSVLDYWHGLTSCVCICQLIFSC